MNRPARPAGRRSARRGYAKLFTAAADGSLSSKIPLWLETSPFRGKRVVDKTAKPMKSFSVPLPSGRGNPHDPFPSVVSVSRRMGRLWIETFSAHFNYAGLCCVIFAQKHVLRAWSISPLKCSRESGGAKIRRASLLLRRRRNSLAACSSGGGVTPASQNGVSVRQDIFKCKTL